MFHVLEFFFPKMILSDSVVVGIVGFQFSLPDLEYRPLGTFCVNNKILVVSCFGFPNLTWGK